MSIRFIFTIDILEKQLKKLSFLFDLFDSFN